MSRKMCNKSLAKHCSLRCEERECELDFCVLYDFHDKKGESPASEEDLWTEEGWSRSTQHLYLCVYHGATVIQHHCSFNEEIKGQYLRKSLLKLSMKPLQVI